MRPKKQKKELAKDNVTFRQQRIDEREKALHALARAKALEHKYADRLVTMRTPTCIIRALPYTMQRIEQELFGNK